jgi:UDP-N-acetylmuramate dehydrogenase
MQSRRKNSSSALAKNGYRVRQKLGLDNVYFKLEKGNEADIRTAMDDFMCRRKSKQPLEFPSAGSTFKRPEGYFAGGLIEQNN